MLVLPHHLTLCWLGLSLAMAVHAQPYRCSTADSTYFSDRPCPAGPTPRINVYGSGRANATTSYSPPQPGPGKMQDHVKYLSPECASIAEGIRTAPTRGVRGSTIAGLHEEYRQKCQLNDQDARRLASQDAADQTRQQLAQRDAVARDRKAAQVRADQCAGMRDVIATKRARESSLNPSEVSALRSLEQTFNERCIAR